MPSCGNSGRKCSICKKIVEASFPSTAVQAAKSSFLSIQKVGRLCENTPHGFPGAACVLLRPDFLCAPAAFAPFLLHIEQKNHHGY